MHEIRQHRPVLLIMAAFSRYDQALAWARRTTPSAWGPVAMASEPFPFDQTTYYEPTMGAGLKKVLLAFQSLIDPATLPQRKLQAIQWEHQYGQEHPAAETRPLNLDPGYVTEAKLILASTKDRDHRIYLSHGIFAENTLFFHAGAWCDRPWTYPDYQQAGYHQFLTRCRDYYRQRRREWQAAP